MRLLTFALALALAHAGSAAERRLRVGVTLPPYFSWVANLAAGAPIDVVPLLKPGADAHGYQASPDDLKRVGELDAVVTNGLGHDDFVKPILASAARKELVTVDTSAGLALIGHNSHTFLSIAESVTQIQTIERALAKLAPAHAATIRANAGAYTRRLRQLKQDTLRRMKGLKVSAVATVHDGYAYLLQELGITVGAVIEPSHGVEPSASELAKTIDAIRRARVKVVFSELQFSPKLLDVIRAETGARVETLDHMGGGAFSAERFEAAMKANFDAIVRAFHEAK
jgi:zinc transport system substrate-binding protein